VLIWRLRPGAPFSQMGLGPCRTKLPFGCAEDFGGAVKVAELDLMNRVFDAAWEEAEYALANNTFDPPGSAR
jgi:hypothetical protein